MSTYYVIRAGRVRGEGAYYCGGCGPWTSQHADAFPFESRAEAERTHEVLMGRGRVVKVTRRTPDEIRAAERAAIVRYIRRQRDGVLQLSIPRWSALDSIAVEVEAEEYTA